MNKDRSIDSTKRHPYARHEPRVKRSLLRRLLDCCQAPTSFQLSNVQPLRGVVRLAAAHLREERARALCGFRHCSLRRVRARLARAASPSIQSNCVEFYLIGRFKVLVRRSPSARRRPTEPLGRRANTEMKRSPARAARRAKNRQDELVANRGADSRALQHSSSALPRHPTRATERHGVLS